jgi:hypothetical protein
MNAPSVEIVELITGMKAYGVLRDIISLIKGTAGKSEITVTEDMARAAMRNAPLKTQQTGASLPAIQRYVNRLLTGEKAPPITVDDGIIVDGNHRYIAGRIVGKEPDSIVGAGGNPDWVIDWDNFKFDPADWGNE